MLAPLFAALLLLTTGSPPPRGHAALGWDGGRARVVLSGGLVFTGSGGEGLTLLSDVWSWDGAEWTQIASDGPKLAGQALAYDGKRKRLLEFGGWLGGSRESGDLHALVDERWSKLASAPQLAHADCAFAYDRARDRLVLFGGGGTGDETWEWDGAAWALSAAKGPPGKVFAKIVYDVARRRVVLWSGSLGEQRFGNVWEYDGREWRQAVGGGPGPRVWCGLVYDEKRKRTVLFGGMGRSGDPEGTPATDTWAFDGSTWKKIADQGPAGLESVVAYDVKRDRIVLFGVKSHENGGSGAETWEFDGARWERKR